MVTKPTSYRLEPYTLRLLEQLSKKLELKRPQVLRLAIERMAEKELKR